MRFLRLCLFFLATSLSGAVAFTWSGGAGDHQYNNPANWLGGVVPPNNGSAILVFGNAQDCNVVLPFILDVAQIQFQNTCTTPYSFDSSFFTILTIHNGITSSPTGGVERIGDNITLNLSGGSQSINVTSGSLEIAGAIFGNSLIKTGAGNLRISGFNLLSGNTQVDNGALLFSNLDALPFSGLISTSREGYVGAENSATLKSMLGQLDRSAFYGTIGLDSAPGSATPAVFSDQIDVTGLTNYAGIGSTTSARLIGNFRVNSGQDYRFSGGAGTLYVETNLTSSNSSLLINSAIDYHNQTRS